MVLKCLHSSRNDLYNSLQCNVNSLFMDFHDAVYNWDVSVFDLEDNYFAYSYRVILIVQKQDVTALESRLHRATVQD
jgi:hypothetical protein